jgi:ATP-binding cassette subfamily A (ABC1) protein 3
MGILTGDVTPTSGEAYVASYDVTGVTKDGVRFARKNIGFCPQADPLLDLMTGRETLAMFGRLRGIPVGSLVCQIL